MGKKYFISTLLALMFLVPPAGAADLAGVDIHGFVSQGFLMSDKNNYYSVETEDGSFQFNEMGINFGKTLTDRLRVGMQIFSRDFGRTANNEVDVDWAYGDYRWQDWLGFRAGLMKMPHGLYNETRDQDMVRTSVLLPQSVYPELVRDYYTKMWGAELYGNIFTESVGNLSYRVLAGTYNPDVDNSGLSVSVAGAGMLEITEFNHGIQYSGSLIWETPLEGLRFGATGWIMNDAGGDMTLLMDFGPDAPAGSATGLEVKRWSTVYSVEYTWNDLRLAAEYRLEHTENEWVGLAFDDWEVDSEGYYIGASYRFTDWFELGAFYSVWYPDKDDKDGDGQALWGLDDFWAWQKDYALSARFDINEYWLVKIEGHAMDGAADMLVIDNSEDLDQHAFLFAAKVTFNF